MTSALFGLEATGDPRRWRLPLVARHCVGPPGAVFLFGGLGLPDGAPADRPALAVLADYVPSYLGGAIGFEVRGNSLDNTVRFVAPGAPGWVLADVTIAGAGSGFAHGEVRLFDENGRLLALGSQSFAFRRFRAPDA